MNIINSALRREERAIFDLRELYEQSGYRKYKMSKFEEYDLYLANKRFLPGGQVVTFTDANGRLMALKPDVTLSIAKNVPTVPTEPEKVYYNENVYRTPRGADEFKEIMQVGLECNGSVDLYSEYEVVSLACRSLQKLSDENVMALSHMGFVAGLMGACALPETLNEKLLRCIGHKNAHEVARLCREGGVSDENAKKLVSLTSLCGELNETIAAAEKIADNDKMRAALDELSALSQVLSDEEKRAIRLDFSVVNDLAYYNGLIFQGFIGGVPSAILSGGRYDNLMEKLSKRCQAIGFAVYLNELERCDTDEPDYDVDVLLLYDAGADVAKLAGAVKMLSQNGQRVRVQTVPSETLRARQTVHLGEGGLEILETND